MGDQEELNNQDDLEAQLQTVRLGLTRLQRLLSSRRVHAGMAGAARVVHPLPVGDLARAARMDTGAVSRQVRVLEEEGLVERHSSPQHGSIVLVVATEEGRAMAHRFERVRSAQLSRALIEWTPEERAQLGALMVRLVDDLQATPYLQTDGD